MKLFLRTIHKNDFFILQMYKGLGQPKEVII